MNFVDERSLRSAVARRGIPLPTSAKSVEQLLVKVNTLAYRIAKTALDAARTISSTGTLQAKTFDDMARLHALLMAPVSSSRQEQQRGGEVLPGTYFGGPQSSAYSHGGGGEVLPGTYFGGPQSSAYSRGGGGSGGLARSAMTHTPMVMTGGAPDYTLPQVYFGGPESSAYSLTLPPPAPVDSGFVRNALTSTFPASPLLMGGNGGGNGGGFITDDAIDRIIKEYKARHAGTMRISDGARQRLRLIVNANISMLIVAVTQSKRKGSKKKGALDVTGFTKVAKQWTLRL